MSQFVELNGISAVAAIDINMSTPYFEKTIAKDLADDGKIDETYETYFLATKNQKIVLSSSN